VLTLVCFCDFVRNIANPVQPTVMLRIKAILQLKNRELMTIFRMKLHGELELIQLSPTSEELQNNKPEGVDVRHGC
jgi:hypothetical protein